MKHFTRRLLTLTMALSMTGSAAALAAEATPVDSASAADQSPAISVQLDGQALTFTDAVPQVVDQRTFLPFRAVFEAMGAEVSTAGPLCGCRDLADLCPRPLCRPGL